MNDTPKFVVSTTLEKAEWNNSTLIKDNVAEEITRLKSNPARISGFPAVSASSSRCCVKTSSTSLGSWFIPVVGNGKRLFENVGDQTALELVESKTFNTGVLYLTYQPAHS